MPACGQAVGCGVCDTPELWCGVAGLCARVRACAGAAESLHTYIHDHNSLFCILYHTPPRPFLRRLLAACEHPSRALHLG